MSKKLCKKHTKNIVDAERHRRTAGTPVTWSKEMGSEKSAGFRDIGGDKMHQKWAKGNQKGANGDQKWAKSEPKVSQGATKMHKKIDLRKRLRKRSDHWWERDQRRCYGGAPFGDHFRRKSEKRHQKRHAKINVEKVLKINAKSDQKWYQNGYPNQ